jgi:hypothetical protein
MRYTSAAESGPIGPRTPNSANPERGRRSEGSQDIPGGGLLMHRFIPFALALGVVALLGGAAPALAQDNTGTPGKLVGLEHVDNDSDSYTTHRGRIWLDIGGGALDQYRWGGTLCAGRDLDIDQQQLLITTMAQKKGVVVPFWKNGQAGVRCLVRFYIVPNSKIAAGL